jgi:hypothetical protein
VEINIYQDATAVTIFCEFCIEIKNIMAHVVLVAGKHCISKVGNDLIFRQVLLIRPNTTYRSSKIVFFYTVHVSAIQISHHQVDVGYTNINIKGERVMNYNNIIPKTE